MQIKLVEVDLDPVCLLKPIEAPSFLWILLQELFPQEKST